VRLVVRARAMVVAVRRRTRTGSFVFLLNLSLLLSVLVSLDNNSLVFFSLSFMYCCFLTFGRCEQEQQRQKQPPRPMGAPEN